MLPSPTAHRPSMVWTEADSAVDSEDVHGLVETAVSVPEMLESRQMGRTHV